MRRRDFFKAGAQVAAAGVAVSASAAGASEKAAVAPATLASEKTTPVPIVASNASAPAVLKSYTADDHRRRLQNIAVGTREIRACMRKHLVTNYLPGQCCYNLGEYPCRKPWEIGEYDERELERLRDHGIQLIQVFDDWNDSLRLCGGDKFTSLNPAGFRRFVASAHRCGIKVLAYGSTGFLQWTDPDFRPEWAPPGSRCSLGFWDMAHCSPSSPGWRAYLLPRLLGVLENYGVDGIYIDCGYVTNATKTKLYAGSPLRGVAKDAVAAFEETPTYDGALTDLLALLYEEVRRRGGIMKLHIDGAFEPQSGGIKLYDYLWVGEGIGNAERLREEVKNHRPYVVPCIDMSFAKVDNEDEQFLHAIPYMQFPVMQAGKPYTGERGAVPGVRYVSDNDFWMQRCRKVREHRSASPNGPHVYGSWDAVPGRAETRPKHAAWLKRYRPLVEDGTWAWLEVRESSLFAGPLPKDVVASVFANRELYVVAANYGSTAAVLETAASYVADEPGADAAPSKRWPLAPRSLRILRRCGESKPA